MTITRQYTFMGVNFLLLLVIAILFVAFARGCFGGTPAIAHVDTVMKIVESSVPQQAPPAVYTGSKQPINVYVPGSTQPTTVREIVVKNDTTQLYSLLNKFFAENYFSNTLPIINKQDTMGSVTINDTISQNGIKGRSYSYKIEYPEITKTIPYKERNQFYLGLGVMGDQISLINAFKVGALLKNKNGDIFGIAPVVRYLQYGSATVPGQRFSLGAELSYYKLITFRKK